MHHARARSESMSIGHTVHMQLLLLLGGTRSIDQFATGKYYYLAFY
jgi:hypothetical protein